MAAVARDAQFLLDNNMILKPCDRGSMAILWGHAKHLAAMTARAEGFETMRDEFTCCLRLKKPLQNRRNTVFATKRPMYCIQNFSAALEATWLSV